MKTRFGITLGIALAFLVAGCQEEGPAEEAGKNVDEATEEAEEKVKEGVEEMGDAIEETGDAIEEKTEDATKK